MNDEKTPSPPNDIRDTSWRRPHFELNFRQESVFRFLMMTAAAIVIFAGIKAASSIIAPMLISLFATIILLVPFRWLKSKGFSDFLALLVVIGSTILLFIAFGLLVGNSLNDFINKLPAYKEKINREVEMIDKQYGFAIGNVFTIPSDTVKETPQQQEATTETTESSESKAAEKTVSNEPTRVEIDMEWLMSWIKWGVIELRHLAENGFFILIITIFMIFEAAKFPEKLNRAFGKGPINNEHFHRIASEIRRYLLYKGGTNLISVTAVTIFYFWLGVPYALLWGLIAFFLYFIPNIGSVIASIIPALLVFMNGDLNALIILVVGLVIIESVIGYGLEPRILGHGLGISTVVVFLSLIFWGWILGPTGLFLAAPLTIMVKIILQAFKETEWIAILLGDSR